jgi:MFS family permease
VETSQLLYAAAAAVTLIGNILTCFIPATGPALRETPALSGLLGMMAHPRTLVSGILQFTSALGYGLVLGVFGKYIEDTYGSAWIGRAIWLYPAVRMALSFFGGYFADRFGHTPVLITGFLASAAGLGVTIAWVSPFAVLITVGTLGLLSSTVPVVAAAMVGDAAGISRRPLAYGIVFAWRDLGVGVAAIGASLLGLSLDFDAVFTIFICIFGCCGLLSVYLGRFANQDI